MNKEEIEYVEGMKLLLNIAIKVKKTKMEINNQACKTLLKYIQYLEQKSETLDKVKEFVTKISTENAEKYNSIKQKEVDFSEWNLADGILNIIEGEKKNGKINIK